MLWFGTALALVGCHEETRRSTTDPCGPDCTLAVDTAWSSDPDNPDLTLTYSAIERGDSLLIVDARVNRSLALLGPSGATARVVGRAGDGPGEYRSISAIDAHPDGRVFVFDRRRLTVLDTALRVALLFPLPMTVEKGVVLLDGTAVVDGSRRIGDSTFTLHLIGEGGQLLSSFDPSVGDATSRFIARGRDNTVWSAPRIASAPEYRIDRWDPRTGRLLQSIRDEPSWFTWTPPTYSADERACRGGDRSACDRADQAPRPPRAPIPTILHLWESDDGLLWIVSYKADSAWASSPPSDYRRRLDSVVEVRDARTGGLIATREFDEYLTGFTNVGGLVMHDMDDQDRPRHTLIRVSVRRSTGKPAPRGE